MWSPTYYPGCDDNMPYPEVNQSRRSMNGNGGGYWGGAEEVNGVIIGGDSSERYYEFWLEGDTPSVICSTHAESDAAAIEWFKTHWSAAFKAGAEMRAFN